MKMISNYNLELHEICGKWNRFERKISNPHDFF